MGKNYGRMISSGLGKMLDSSQLQYADKKTEESFENLKRLGSARAQRQFDRWLGVMLRHIGGEVVKTARSILDGERPEGVNIPDIEEVTRMLRARNKGGSALREFGRLKRGLYSSVPRSRDRIEFGARGNSVPKRRGQHTIPLDRLLFNIEMGYSFTVTRKMRSYFRLMAQSAQSLKPTKDGQQQKGSRHKTRGGRRVSKTQAEGWLRMAAMKEGAIVQVNKRPIIEPSIQLVMGSFVDRYRRSGSESMMTLLTQMRVSTPWSREAGDD